MKKKIMPGGTEVIADKRNYGIDLLRILSMFYVIVLHTLGKGGILSATVQGSTQYSAAWLLEVFAYGAVDIFALISGYVSFSESEKKVNYANYILLWLEVAGYGVVIVLLAQLIAPDSVAKSDLLTVLFPVTNDLYWYFTAYTALFAVMPVLNAAVRKCSKQTLRKVIILIFTVFSVYDSIVKRFEIKNGYSFIWIALLYLMGMILKKCEIGARAKVMHLVFGIIGLGLVAWLWKLYGAEFRILNITVTRDFFISYTSPAVLGSSLLYVLLFAKMNIRGAARKMVSFAAPGAFAAYILNNNFLIWQHLMHERFAFAADKTIYILGIVIVFAFCFVAAAVLIDKVRVYIFRLLRLRQIAQKAVMLAEKAITEISEKL